MLSHGVPVTLSKKTRDSYSAKKIVFQLVRLFFMHLTASIIAIILLCPTTIKWLSEQLGIDYDIIFNEIPDKFRQILKNFR